jgi:hypothetical protein
LNREKKGQAYLSLMLVDDADIEGIEAKLLKDQSVTCGTPLAANSLVTCLQVPADRALPPSG